MNTSHLFLGSVKSLCWVTGLTLAFAVQTPAQLRGAGGRDVPPTVRTYEVDEVSKDGVTSEDIRSLTGLKVWAFKVRCSEFTNGFSVLVEIKTDGQPTNTVARLDLDRTTLLEALVREEALILVAIHPVDGEEMDSAKEWRFVIREIGVRQANGGRISVEPEGVTAQNPFHDGSYSLSSASRAERQSSTAFSLMEGVKPSGANKAITVRFLGYQKH
jgi:hypothetical protein